MGGLIWPDGATIKGVTVFPGKQGGAPSFLIDFDLTPPDTKSSAAKEAYLSQINDEYGFLPIDAGLVRQADMMEIDACFHFAQMLTENIFADPGRRRDFVAAMGCVCFHDPYLKSGAIMLDDEDDDAVERFMFALDSLYAAAFSQIP